MTIREYYEDAFDEHARLGADSLEWIRSRELIGRIIPAAPARVADVAGGTGPYAVWLAGQGHRVSLLDLVPSHVDRARERAAAVGVAVECVVGDARALPWPDGSFDVVLIMGALYHLQERADRLACLREARRVLVPGGALAAAYISRWASLVDSYRYGFVADARFASILADDLATGRHENPGRHPDWFTTSYFHTPAEIAGELAEVGFTDVEVLAVEGFTSATGVPDALRGESLPVVLDHLRSTEREPALLGMSSHLMSLSRRP